MWHGGLGVCIGAVEIQVLQFPAVVLSYPTMKNLPSLRWYLWGRDKLMLSYLSLLSRPLPPPPISLAKEQSSDL